LVTALRLHTYWPSRPVVLPHVQLVEGAVLLVQHV
jgi:hypothetical protein